MAVQGTVHSLANVLWWNLIGQYMAYVYRRERSPFYTRILLPHFNPGAPGWWLETWGHTYIWDANLTYGVPNGAFVWYYKEAAKNTYSWWIDATAQGIAQWWDQAIYTRLGTLYYGFTSFGELIRAIWIRVGPNVPSWASNMMEALWNLWGWFPGDIRDNVVSWYDKFVAWYNAAISWAQSRYETTKVWVANTGAWLVAGYNTVRAWYDSSHDWLDDFRYNIYDRITAWLGPPWTFLYNTWQQLQSFYNNVWVPYQVTLHDFLADPLGWLYDRVEAELIRRW